ncbi:MAG: flagellar export protein FliJ [Candidatus Sericytochromatia bacterium]|nr:flagellar export protein FliJ [Candidatus Sericytochromatia bacterium]
MAPTKRFVYQLQKILDMRTRKEDQLKAELAGSIRTRDLEVAALNTLVEKRGKAQKSLEGYLSRGEVAEVQNTNLFLQNLTGKIDNQNRIVTKSNLKVEDVRKKLTQASKEKKIIEKHKEKKNEEWKEEFKKWENKLMDEIASQIFNRQMRKKEDVLQEDTRYQENTEKRKLMLALKVKSKKKF